MAIILYLSFKTKDKIVCIPFTQFISSIDNRML